MQCQSSSIGAWAALHLVYVEAILRALSAEQVMHLLRETGGIGDELVNLACLKFAERQVVCSLPALEQAVECAPPFGINVA